VSADLIHEHLELHVTGVMLIVSHRLFGVVGCVGTDELGARLEEHVLKSGFIPPLDLLHLVGIFFIQTALDVSIQ